ncbi:cytochrome c [Aneurinibacillus thermoaerophilus]|uniref:c-type cytochrome n=1 Tax=Aneurinibacillus thermoaerophilus TaxID=143495 RepID=UPI002E21786D|nr:cytochrome c [Aneurinibacillus thermoaerophilus]
MSDKHKNHEQHEEHYDEVMGMKQGHGKVPRFLIITYAVLAVWAVGYALNAKGIDERPAGGEAAQGVSVEKGKGLSGQCVACHGADLKGGMGPSLYGIVDKLKPEGVKDVLTKGRGSMPALGASWTEEQKDSMVEFLKTLK